ncbi:MAG: methylenetetrahydrofolate reductase C-terminal domain-containing protein [Chloroflexi bacterium]|nr:methylenetetrahydrofolate reductase C-terminal domain-containing protein [Chloroflexota bacterium]
MIVAEQKPFEEIEEMLADYRRILVVGCGACVTVCAAGGEKEVGILSSALRIAAKAKGLEIEIVEKTIVRQCEPEYVEGLREYLADVDVVLSLGCGVGVQHLAEAYPKIRVLPGLNTGFMGGTREHGVWAEACAGCGNCILAETGGICPIARCSKSLLNGPCGGSHNGKCEISDEVDCAWQLIYDHLQALGLTSRLVEIRPTKDWATARDGGPRKVVREDLRL